jgi:hypothetical protein
MRHFQPNSNREDRTGSRRRLSYANVAATLALVTALGGGTAWAANHIHYLIVSTHQIKPSVLKQLHGAKGASGTNGTNGTNGAQGPAGPAGAAGAVAGYAVTEASPVTFTAGTLGSPTTVLSLNVPAGSFLVNAKNVVTAENSVPPNSTDYADVTCQLVDGSTSDTAWWGTSFTPETTLFGGYFGRSTLPTEIAVSSSAASTVTLNCDMLSDHTVGTISLIASYGEIQAVQTSSNSGA